MDIWIQSIIHSICEVSSFTYCVSDIALYSRDTMVKENSVPAYNSEMGKETNK